jgi:hypothetical protein
VTLPSQILAGTRFLVVAAACQTKNNTTDPTRGSVSEARQPQNLQRAGERWQMTVRLKVPQRNSNPWF